MTFFHYRGSKHRQLKRTLRKTMCSNLTKTSFCLLWLLHHLPAYETVFQTLNIFVFYNLYYTFGDSLYICIYIYFVHIYYVRAHLFENTNEPFQFCYTLNYFHFIQLKRTGISETKKTSQPQLERMVLHQNSQILRRCLQGRELPY